MPNSSEVDIAIIGAGAAGIAAAKSLMQAGKSFVLLEASHRIGGRAYTEEIFPGVPVDLGCHWLHSASLNPLVKVADAFGITYLKEGFPRGVFSDGKWSSDEDSADWDRFYERQAHAMQEAAAGEGDRSIFEATEREDRWTPIFDYIYSLHTSFDVDQVSVTDLMAYNDTNEDWPLREGYGTLMSRFGADIPVSLNCAVHTVEWSGKGVTLETAQGTVSAHRALVTVSTGILGAGDIRFVPELPVWKKEAIAALPLGCHNRICLGFDRDVFGPDARAGFTTDVIDDVPMSLYLRPFDYNLVVAVTGGRFAEWLERAGQQASIDYVEKKLQAVFGSDITKHVTAHIVTAWRGDPWVKGAYSAARPGQAHQRAELAKSLDEKVFFAGEATSSEFYSTAHGAYLTGIAAANAMV
ncbi:MAG: flavin monoamine oxidase family protein [Hyphomicrobiales bacterium]